MNNDLEVAHPQSISLSTWFLVEYDFFYQQSKALS